VNVHASSAEGIGAEARKKVDAAHDNHTKPAVELTQENGIHERQSAIKRAGMDHRCR